MPAKSYSVLEHIGRSVWGQRYSPESLFAMFTCYFDEAGGADHGFTLVAGYVSNIEQWEHFEVDWKLSLISFSVPYFHMAKLSQFKGPFAKWGNTPNFRARFIREMADIIQRRALRGFACYVDHAEFERADREYELKETLGSPYALAGRLCIANARAWRWRIAKQLDMEYVFEDGGPDKAGLIKSIDIEPKLSAPIFKPSRDIQDRKTGLRRGVVQLQAADYLAYEIRKYVKDYIKTESKKSSARGSLAALTGVEVDRYFLAYKGIVEVCKALGLKKRKL